MDQEINNGVKRAAGKAIKGKKIWYFTQAVTAPVGSPAIYPAYQTEGTTTLGGDNIDEQTKQGRVIEKSTDEHSIELTQYFAPDDEGVDEVIKAKKNGNSLKVWRVVVDESVAVEEGDHKAYPAMFGYGMPDEVELSDSTDDLLEVSYTLNIIGQLQDGTFPLSDEEVADLDAMYKYQRPGETTGDYDDIQYEDDSTTTTTTEATTTTTTEQK